jgi:TetR/AcrR family transcriptional repressor of nem operon
VRITKAQKRENHERIVAVASHLFRERGFDGVGVAELMERASLTHGGFYNHFASKDELVSEATGQAFAQTTERYGGCASSAVIELYVSREHRDARAEGCPAAALGCEAARQPDATRSVFGAGIENLVALLQADLEQGDAPDARARAIAVLAEAVGAVVLSRACPDNSPLADEILGASRVDCLERLSAPAWRKA